jgi:hypothetical protein
MARIYLSAVSAIFPDHIQIVESHRNNLNLSQRGLTATRKIQTLGWLGGLTGLSDLEIPGEPALSNLRNIRLLRDRRIHLRGVSLAALPVVQQPLNRRFILAIIANFVVYKGTRNFGASAQVVINAGKGRVIADVNVCWVLGVDW